MRVRRKPTFDSSGPGCTPFWGENRCPNLSKAMWMPRDVDSDAKRDIETDRSSWYIRTIEKELLTDVQSQAWQQTTEFELLKTLHMQTQQLLASSVARVKPPRHTQQHLAASVPVVQSQELFWPRLQNNENKRPPELFWAKLRANDEKRRKVAATKKNPKTRPVLCKDEHILYPQRERTVHAAIMDLNNNPQKENPIAIITRRFRLSLTDEQHKKIQSYNGAYRWMYNQLVSMRKNTEYCREICGTDRIESVRHARTCLLRRIETNDEWSWARPIPNTLLDLATREYGDAVKVARKLHPDGKFEMHFKTAKGKRKQTIRLGKRSISINKFGLRIFSQTNQGYFAWKKESAVCKDREFWKLLGITLNEKRTGNNPPMDCELVYDRGTHKYEIHIPLERTQTWANVVVPTHLENQEDVRTIALDPGVRAFLTGYSPDGRITTIAKGDEARLFRIAHKIDKINSFIRLNELKRKTVKHLIKKRMRIYSKLSNYVKELHMKTAKYLCTNYDIILLPSFGTRAMLKKLHPNGRRRKINRNTARKMMMLSHYKFRVRLIHKARQCGRALIIVNEAYTSKTCTACGWQNHKLGRQDVFTCTTCKVKVGRDVNGARNILLRNLC